MKTFHTLHSWIPNDKEFLCSSLKFAAVHRRQVGYCKVTLVRWVYIVNQNTFWTTGSVCSTLNGPLALKELIRLSKIRHFSRIGAPIYIVQTETILFAFV